MSQSNLNNPNLTEAEKAAKEAKTKLEEAELAEIERRIYNENFRRELAKYPSLDKSVNEPDIEDSTALHRLVSVEDPDLKEIDRLVKNGALTLFQNKKGFNVYQSVHPRGKFKKMAIYTGEENPIVINLEQYITMCMLGEAFALTNDPDFPKRLLLGMETFQQFDWPRVPVPNSTFWALQEPSEYFSKTISRRQD